MIAEQHLEEIAAVAATETATPVDRVAAALLAEFESADLVTIVKLADDAVRVAIMTKVEMLRRGRR